jgi:hypothetical protein
MSTRPGQASSRSFPAMSGPPEVAPKPQGRFWKPGTVTDIASIRTSPSHSDQGCGMRTKQIIATLPVKSVAILIGVVLAVALNAGIASAGVYFRICNDGGVPMLLVVKDNYSFFSSNPTVSGWYQVDPGECYGKNGQIDITVGFYTKGTKVSTYYDFDPPKVTSGCPIGCPIVLCY